MSAVPWWVWVLAGASLILVPGAIALGVMGWLEVRAASSEDSESTS